MKAKSERRRPFIGDQIDECRDASGLFFILGFQRGYLTNWDVQKTLWDHMFSADCTSTNFSEPLIITEPQFNFPSIQEAITEIFFEEYECETLLRTTAADLSAYHWFKTQPIATAQQPTTTTVAAAATVNHKAPAHNKVPKIGAHSTNGTAALRCAIVVDMGYSFTHIVPFIRGTRVKNAIRRIDVGGKLLTNHLKEMISYRQLNVMDESYVINQVKEDACYAAVDFNAEMELARRRGPANTVCREYVLPDFTTLRRGFMRTPSTAANAPVDPDQQLLRLGNERFVIPELLFHPSDVGVRQMGVSEAIVNAVQACLPEAAVHLFANIVIVGGCACFPGMQARLERDLRALVPDELDVRVRVPEK